MDAKVLQATDIAGGSFSLLLVASLAATVLLFLGTGWVERRWKLPVALAGLITLIATLHYYEARAVWLATGGQMPVILRYAAWLVAVPVQVATVYFFAAALGAVPVGLFWRLIVVAAGMVLARYMGETGFMNATLGFLIGIVGWLYILGEFFFGALATTVNKSDNEAAQTGMFWLRLIATVGWAIYPLCYFVAAFAGGADVAKLNIVYNLADLVNERTFALAVLTTAMRGQPARS